MKSGPSSAQTALAIMPKGTTKKEKLELRQRDDEHHRPIQEVREQGPRIALLECHPEIVQ
jgi:hypothetical protein